MDIGTIRRSIEKFQALNLDIRIVSLRQPTRLVQELLDSY